MKQAAYNWFELLKSTLESRGYTRKNSTDPCAFIRKYSIVLVYFDNYLIFSRKNSYISDRLTHSLTNIKEIFEFTNEGELSKYLRVDINNFKDGSIEITQPHLLDIFVKLID